MAGLPALARLPAGVCLLSLAAGCTGTAATTPHRPGTTLPSPAARGPARPGPSAPARPPDTLPRGAGLVAGRYLAARENVISSTHPGPRSWLADVRAVMTAAGWQRLAATLGGDGGFPAATARAHRWSVRASTACRPDPDAGPASSTQTILTCTVVDRTVDTAGRAVPARNLPAIWPYTGPQPPALLVLRRLDGQWLVDADLTGQAD